MIHQLKTSLNLLNRSGLLSLKIIIIKIPITYIHVFDQTGNLSSVKNYFPMDQKQKSLTSPPKKKHATSCEIQDVQSPANFSMMSVL